MEKETLMKLRKVVKRKCKITWNDADTEQRVTEIVENAEQALRHKIGMGDVTPEVFLKPGMTRTLFENYCMYDWNNMLEEFELNYKRELLAERHKYEVKNAKKEDE